VKNGEDRVESQEETTLKVAKKLDGEMQGYEAFVTALGLEAQGLPIKNKAGALSCGLSFTKYTRDEITSFTVGYFLRFIYWAMKRRCPVEKVRARSLMIAAIGFASSSDGAMLGAVVQACFVEAAACATDVQGGSCEHLRDASEKVPPKADARPQERLAAALISVAESWKVCGAARRGLRRALLSLSRQVDLHASKAFSGQNQKTMLSQSGPNAVRRRIPEPVKVALTHSWNASRKSGDGRGVAEAVHQIKRWDVKVWEEDTVATYVNATCRTLDQAADPSETQHVWGLQKDASDIGKPLRNMEFLVVEREDAVALLPVQAIVHSVYTKQFVTWPAH
jgi:hypothetical protein